MAERDFISAKGAPDLEVSLMPILNRINTLQVQYNEHVERYKALAEKIDREMTLLNYLKH